MKSQTLTRTLAVGLAMFSMFFGAGNAIFPLLLGQETGNQNAWAMLGMFVTAIVVPFTGLLAVVLFDSDYKRLFNLIGRVPGYLLAAVIVLLIGPLAGIPRCIALSYASADLMLPSMPFWAFSGGACLIVYLFTMKESRIVALLGYVLTPILLLCLAAVIVLGLVGHPAAAETGYSSGHAFMHGLREGYNTLDLLAAFFFSGVVLASIRAWYPKKEGEDDNKSRRQVTKVMAGASLVGAVLLGAVYTGLSFVASYHAAAVADVDSDQMLAAIGFHLLGGKAGVIANVAVALACLTTAVALTATVARFLRRRVLSDRISYNTAVLLTLGASFGISFLRVSGIVKLIAPILVVCYPALIALSLLGIALQLGRFGMVKRIFYGTLGATVWAYLS